MRDLLRRMLARVAVLTRRPVVLGLGLAAAVTVAGLVAAGLLLRGPDRAGAAKAERVALVPEGERRRLPAIEGATLIPPPARLALATLRGKPLFLDVWASWCKPCREEAPGLARLARRYAGDVQFVGLDTQDTLGPARAFVRRYGLSFPHLFDPRSTLAGRLAVFGIPTVLLVDRRGRIAATIVGKRTEKTFDAYLRLLTRPAR